MQKVVSLSPHPATFPYLTTLGSGWESLGLSWPGPGHPLARTLGIQTKARETLTPTPASPRWPNPVSGLIKFPLSSQAQNSCKWSYVKKGPSQISNSFSIFGQC